MILYHSQAQISTAQGDVQEQEQLAGADKPHLLLLPAHAPGSVHLLLLRFISALPPCAFVVNMSRTTKKPNSEESNATTKIDLSDLRLCLRTAIRVHSVRLPARAFRH